MPASSAVIERNPPPAPKAPPTEIAPPPAPAASDDTRPLGPTLGAIVLLGAKDALRTGAESGIDASAVARLDTDEGRGALAPFLGRPISRKLVSDIAAAIVRYYRAQGFPFVSVTIPPQEITSGMVQFRVVEFTLGAIGVKGNVRTPSEYLVGSLRVRTGAPIDANLLSEDLDALNRYPYRSVQAAFTPGAALGETDLELSVTEQAPWRVYAGYSNSGTASTGWDRYNLGASVGDLLLDDSILSYQFTTSADFWDDHGTIFGAAGHPHYLSHATSFTAPVFPHQFVDFDFNWVQTHTLASGTFDVGQRTYEGSLGYELALSDYVPLPGDLHVALEAKRDERSTFFGSVKIVDGAIEVYQMSAGWSDYWGGSGEYSSFDTTLHWSPGGLDAANTKTAYAAFTPGLPHGTPHYAYANLAFMHRASLPYGFSLIDQVTAQASSAALPDTEQAGIGGQTLVRGYTLDDGAFDSTIVARNELRAPAFGVVSAWDIAPDLLSPYIFADLGYGNARASHFSQSADSVGVGADYAIGPWFQASVDGAYALHRALVTHDGDWRLESRVTASW